MIEPKPLTKEERSLLESWVNGEDAVHLGLKKALAAEAYWREVVKNAQLGDSDHCPWCGVLCPTSDRTTHAPDCAWKFAQE